MTLNELLTLAALALVFAPLEHLRPTRRAPRSLDRLRVDALHVFVSGALIKFGSTVVLVAVAFGATMLVPDSLREAVRSQPEWLQFIEVLLISDLGFYLAHRLFHTFPALWRFHEIHHSSEHLDWIATYRVHPVDQIINSVIIAAPAVLLGFGGLPVLAYALIYRWHAVLLHSNINVDFGPLKWLIASPQYHHWHHADEAAAYDRNFGGQLVIFDRLFGTLNLPRDTAMPAKYGLSEPIPATYLGQLAHPFSRAGRPAQAECAEEQA